MYKLIHRLFSSTKPSGVAKILAPASLAGLAALSVGLIASHTSQTAFATTSSTVTFDITDAVSIRLVDKTDTNVITSLDMSLVVTPKGTFVSDWFNAEISTSNATGYTLYMTSDYQSDGSTYTTDLINSDDATYTIPTLAANVSKTDFSTPGGSYLNRWGYSLDDTTYSPVPAHTTSATLKTTTTEVNKDLVPIHVGVMADMNKASGLYKNSLVFTAIPNPIPTEFELNFEPGITGTVKNLPDTMTSSEIAAQHTFTIPSTKPSRGGYIFSGYLDEDSGTTYQPGDSVTVIGDYDYVGSVTLTAQWEVTPFWSITNMQEMTPEICDSLYTPSNATGSAVTLVDNASAYSVVTSDNLPYVAQRTLRDIRDNNSYTIRKLADGNCWMTSNLKYTLTANSTAIGVNHSTNETFTFNTGAACETDGSCIMNGNTVMTEQVANGGYYYSWYAATAGTGTPEMASGDATGSICPKGWRLPANYTSDPDKSYGSITQAYLGLHEPIWEDFTTTLESMPLQFLRAGYYNVGLFSGVGFFNVTWSSSVKDSPNAYDFNYEDRFIFPQAYHTKYQGFSVRCVAQ